MRYIFFLLLALNGSLLAWGLWSGSNGPVPEGATAPALPQGVTPIRLLDAGVGARPGAEGGGLAQAGPDAQRRNRAAACFSLGPLFGGRRVQDLADRIRATGAAVFLHAPQGELEKDFWVMIPPQASRQEAQLRYQEFRARSVDSFVITQGPMANAISLGLFTQEALAEEQVARLEAMGYTDVELRTIPRENQEIWLGIASWQTDPGNAPAWQSLLTRPADRKWRREPCREPLLSAAHELEFGPSPDR